MFVLKGAKAVGGRRWTIIIVHVVVKSIGVDDSAFGGAWHHHDCRVVDVCATYREGFRDT